MQNIQYVKIEGLLEVNGIYNYNGSERKNGYNNHKGAKKDRSGRDFTSSRCIRHEMFKDIQPRQPSTPEFSKFFISLAASEVGLLRGYLSPDEGFKRSSPLHVADAYTEEKFLVKNHNANDDSTKTQTALIFDQGISSKPKESEKSSKKGDAISDTSIFSQDNAPFRKQIFIGALNLKELQFLSLDDVDPSFRMVAKADEKEFILKLKNYFNAYNILDQIEIYEYKDIGAILNVNRRGILLSQNHIRHLVKISISRIMSIDGLKAGASLKADSSSLKISLGSGDETFTKTTLEFMKDLPNITFKEYYKRA